jgi:anti-sigma regulatory factor (Ser/Thr protein kinase)
MTSNRERGQIIRQQIQRDQKHHPKDISKHIAMVFRITPQAVNNHIRKLENEGKISSSGIGKGKFYTLGHIREHTEILELSSNFTEDKVWRDNFSFVADGLRENIVDICHYGFTEIVNNVIDHSEGTNVYISVRRTEDEIRITVIDNGEGIFSRIKRLCNLLDEKQSILELSKGKLTTDPDNHSGEGVFFTSRVFDIFEIYSKELHFSHHDSLDFDYLMDSDFMSDEEGTFVFMRIKLDSNRDIQETFDEYTAGPDDFQFNKTVIPVKLAAYENEKLVSRSQAKRVLARVDRFSNIIFDFEGVPSVGQAFADEIFRVYAKRNPELNFLPINMNEAVNKMVARALG